MSQKLSEAKSLDEISHEQLHLMSGVDNIARSMIKTRFHHWGFVIYRCAYGDDAPWGRYLEYMKATTLRVLDRRHRRRLLEQYLEWTVIDNRKKLDGASKADAKKLFRNWCANRSETRDGAGARGRAIEGPDIDITQLPLGCYVSRGRLLEGRPVGSLPRFKYCLYVDQKCLDKFKDMEEARTKITDDYELRKFDAMEGAAVGIIIDRLFKPKRIRGPTTEDSNPVGDSSTLTYSGWLEVDLSYLVSVYSDLHWTSLDKLQESK
ncbi:hypothetical protein B0T19DRAFT_152035 [Cercophora scortea]|uniref:Uncharacterized protein n=1 Tax=Cercophora scortea TaxID=314031 RepID=A0AAE0IL65_9PEZI|nr:hypothetical protein B0T19DRAFT_152035 [Cercophora scortea]